MNKLFQAQPTVSEVVVYDGVHWPVGQVTDYKSDATIFLKQLDADAAAKKKHKKDKVEPVAELDSVLKMSDDDA